MVFYQTLAHCDVETLIGTEVIGVTVNDKDAITFETRTISGSYTVDELQASDPAQIFKGAAIYTYATGLQAWQKGDRESGRAWGSWRPWGAPRRTARTMWISRRSAR